MSSHFTFADNKLLDFLFQLIINIDNSGSVIIPAALRLALIGVSNNSVIVTSSAGITISIVNIGSCAGQLTLPLKGLGKEYYAVTWWDNTTEVGSAQVIIII